MFPLLAGLVLLPSQVPSALEVPPESFAKVLEKLGYRYLSHGRGIGTLESPLGETRLFLALRRPESSSAEVVSGLVLNHCWQGSRFMAPSLLRQWSANLGDTGIHFWSYLDHAITAKREIFFDSSFTEQKLKTEIDRFVASGKALESRFGAELKLRSLTVGERFVRPPLNENLLVESVTERDMSYLVDAWGWKFNKGFGGTGGMWTVPAEIGGEDYFLRGKRNEDDSGERNLRVETDVKKPDIADMAAYVRWLKPQVAWGEVTDSRKSGSFQVASTLKIDHPIRVGAIRKFIEDFARNADTLR